MEIQEKNGVYKGVYCTLARVQELVCVMICHTQGGMIYV